MQRPPRCRISVGPLIALPAILALSGCRGDTASDASTDQCVDAPVTLRQTFDCLRGWHDRAAYEAMRPYVDPAACEGLIDLLISVDELMAANAGAQQAVTRVCPEMDAGRLDLAYLESHMDLFSADVSYVREDQKGDQAVATIQVGDRLPLIQLRFRREKQGKDTFRWVYYPGKTVPELAGMLRELARSLNQFTLVLSAERAMSPESVRHEFELRVLSKLRRHAALIASTRPADS